MRLRLVRIRCELDATRLATTARQHLRLDDNRPAEHLGRLPRLTRRRRQTAVTNRNPDPPEQLLALSTRSRSIRYERPSSRRVRLISGSDEITALSLTGPTYRLAPADG